MIKKKYLYSLLFLFFIISSCGGDDSIKEEEISIIVQTENMNFNINENPDENQVIGTVIGTTNKGNLTFSIIEQVPSNSFKINPKTGKLIVDDTTIYDYESLTEITGKIKVSNNEINDTSLIVISIKDVDEDTYFGDVSLKNQEDVDEFGSNMYKSIEGNLKIQNLNDPGTPITDLSSLITLQTIKGNLNISNNNHLTNLKGLDKIITIEKKCIFFSNDILEDISALSDLTAVNSIISDFNPKIKSLSCFSKINVIEGFCSIVENNSLINLEGLNNITSIKGSLSISQNEKLNNVLGLKSLKTVNDYISFTNNHALVNLDGLNNLETIGGSLTIMNNNALIEIDALQSLTVINGALVTTNNDKLTSLSGYSNLIEVKNKLSISFNKKLRSLEGLDNLLKVEGNLTIAENNFLNNFCSLQKLINNNFSSTYIVAGNLFNPTIENIKDGNCSIP